ncbi:methyltransferase [Streptomyces varsoviensis]|uniref:Methyltransferase n=1 Tax=Streptomyces varsoviensis TaxID=67373 RepID=A0ABR5JBH0_9ACTN|nr:methyltransferase [Streptomyces varsoviensis]
MPAEKTKVPDETAVRVALWRALHVQADAAPHVVEDEIGLRLVAPGEDWRRRPDMAGDGMSGFRAGVVARARFVEDLVSERCAAGVGQYVILGAGLDTFVQRQEWKRRRLSELGHGAPKWLHWVPVDFETGEVWWDRLIENGFDPDRPAVLACAGVTMYLSEEAVHDTLRQAARAAAGSTLAMTFVLPTAFVAHAAAGRPKPGPRVHFRSYFTPDAIQDLARKAGFRETRYVSTEEITARYFAGRADDFRPAAGEPFMLAHT